MANTTPRQGQDGRRGISLQIIWIISSTSQITVY